MNILIYKGTRNTFYYTIKNLNLNEYIYTFSKINIGNIPKNNTINKNINKNINSKRVKSLKNLIKNILIVPKNTLLYKNKEYIKLNIRLNVVNKVIIKEKVKAP